MTSAEGDEGGRVAEGQGPGDEREGAAEGQGRGDEAGRGAAGQGRGDEAGRGVAGQGPGDEERRGEASQGRGDEAGRGEPAGPMPGATRPGRRSRLLAVAGAGAVALVLAAIAFREPPGPPGAGERVVLYGDSLSVEAGGSFVAAMGRATEAEVTVKAIPGIAPCDAYGSMQADLADPATRPSVVVIQFTGNNLTDCVAGPGGQALTGPELATRYAQDVRAEVELFARQGVRVVLVGTATAPGLPGGAEGLIDDEYLRIVTEWAGRDIGRVRYAPAGEAVTGPGSAFVTALPCLPGEGPAEGCEGGQVTVRSADRIHFCPVTTERDLTCPAYSSGAARFGGEMARVAAQALSPDY
jgi:hypothetical protein